MSFRRFKSLLLGQSSSPNKYMDVLEAASVPISTAQCRSCEDPCNEGHEDYPSKFGADMDSEMLGSVKPYCRQVVISTGKTDWEKEVTDAKGSLAAHIKAAQDQAPSTTQQSDVPGSKPSVPGVFDPAESSRISILNGSHKTVCDDDDLDTVLVFPDFKVVTGVPRTLGGGEELWKNAIDPGVPRVGGRVAEGSSLKTWVLPYSCVILLCSHKRRDNKCAIAAPKLENAFTTTLNLEGWEVHTQLEALFDSGSCIDDITGSDDDKEAVFSKKLKEIAMAAPKRVLILKNSHVGGHKFAGNVIIYTPTGSGVWYGRVTPHEVPSIVKNTIVEGKVLVPLLRGGVKLSRPGCASLNDW
ncbi:hypothetical protein JAAARDRAFT_28270 [Jaapia argillacea MUCL 33604]|uniref:Sucraseferredoxin-like protein n=1 Tax=Jaapia argillacea MUCL 33604 TaxID=933084 RepID=A0A067QPR4_9AGAM|nr:hypothetical protein JAAARDRAFT_28270 [Jaapia argillacea MUCL 33604]